MNQPLYKLVLELKNQLRLCSALRVQRAPDHPRRLGAEQKLQRLQADWVVVEQGQVDSLRAAVAKHWSFRWASTLRIAFAVLAAGALTGAVFGLDSRELAFDKVVAGLLVLSLIGAFGGWVCASGILRLLQGQRPGVLDALCRAKDQPFMCESALEHVRRYLPCQQWRDTVVASGRELVMLDLDIIGQFAYEALQGQAQAEQEAYCRQLHGLPAAMG